MVAISAPFGGADGRLDVLQQLPNLAVPVLGLYGGDDEHIDTEDVDQAQEASPAGRFIVYEGVGHAFMDAASPDYHPGAEADALARIRAFVEAVSPAPV